MAETDLAGTLKSEYISFAGVRTARRDGPTGAASVFYYVSDRLMTTSVIVNSSGAIKAESGYYPWGGELQFVNSDFNNYKFTGRERDGESGLDQMGARYYGNGLGHFITADSIFLDVGRVFNPQGFNAYSYSLNNPLRFADPTGKAPIDAGLLARINDVKGAVHRAALERVTAYRRNEPGIDSMEGERLTGKAASAQASLAKNFNDASDAFALVNYETAMTHLEAFLLPGVEQGLESALENWINDPGTTSEQLWAALGKIAVADMKNPPKPSEGNDQLKEATESAVRKILDEVSDHGCKLCSIWKKTLELVSETFGDPNHDMRVGAVGSIFAAARETLIKLSAFHSR